VIGGAGSDVLDASGGDVAVYDTPGGLEVEARGRGFEDRRSEDPDVNRYDETENVIGDVVTRPTLGFRDTDGVMIGASRTWLVPGFRLHPYAAVHTVSANYATATSGVAARYQGYMREAIGRSDLTVAVHGSTPRYARNFYGIGNGSPELDDSDRARVDIALAGARAGLVVPLGENLTLNLGPTVRYADATVPEPQAFDPGNPDLPLVGPAALLAAPSFDAQTHVGASARIEARAVDLEANPRQGLGLSLFGELRAGITGPADTYGRVGGEAVAYVPFRFAPQLTLALRGGGETTVGDFPFFDASVLGGPGTIRGYRRERFAGRTAASASAELRAKVLDLDVYVLPLEVGILGFADAGRVWAETPTCLDVYDSEVCALINFRAVDPDAGGGIQLGYGGGLWVGSLDRGVATLTVGASDEAALVTFGVGFAY
ncbi:BamA/TamA family outer membrane protein, partial [Rubrivirga sp.]|uniref:BamA/TamA family outer membrane protein n=1 Tax=Rubrivirga sp. TaxID=1885344 RepID=UPI003C75A6C2